ncbi:MULTISPECIES: four-carbon acid sugar kinase family protein [unclassified Pseudomonas]|uniref:four-carbon acid sugar kinase family protein n=1 Tax=unclassified Pseudomonas TaxID=196821 RepID=UPI000C86C493|nr:MULTISPECIES: four-carbon acid sugar kinase family protein [unclassified Pseudomonas]PMV89833.1 Hrp-dependent type III effector protein [Pseudomonas sp. GW101-1A09]PMV90941.1 Hrp-dependent type III effector protein [Pseudomonas sp. FW306-2-2C-B10A]PMW02983.1 Hrp-dependent type III effector protein [Pseudomonas sp. GW460-C8]PMW03402.1 Hrp-dependent type III effector protein [Pseudomonas sp. MPR-TSA4]PMW22454.1 Hrp-dependent type III effector protein [Pseudomonas sp. FW306-2-1A-C05A]
MRILIIADDLSGAADCAIGFASVGMQTVVTLDPLNDEADAQVIAADTDTRRLPPARAAERTVAAFKALHKPGQRLYKKIDSTLRGNWAAEVAALQPLAGLAIVAPAFPATGRTLRGGRVFVNGQPLENTDTWKLENADRPADVEAMLIAAGLSTATLDLDTLRGNEKALERHIAEIAGNGTQALIVDAQTEDDLLTLARLTASMDQPLFWIGSGGLAREIASLPDLSEARFTTIEPATLEKSQAPILILVGSLSGVCERQCERLKERGGVSELVIPPEVLRQGTTHGDWSLWQSRIGEQLDGWSDLLLRIGRDEAFDPQEGGQLSTMLAVLVEPHFAKVGGLIATGGETARAILTTVGIDSLQLLTEIEAGVAFARPTVSRQGHRPGIVTKAGAFGTDNALYAAWQHLSDSADRSPPQRTRIQGLE